MGWGWHTCISCMLSLCSPTARRVASFVPFTIWGLLFYLFYFLLFICMYWRADHPIMYSCCALTIFYFSGALYFYLLAVYSLVPPAEGGWEVSTHQGFFSAGFGRSAFTTRFHRPLIPPPTIPHPFFEPPFTHHPTTITPTTTWVWVGSIGGIRGRFIGGYGQQQ